MNISAIILSGLLLSFAFLPFNYTIVQAVFISAAYLILLLGIVVKELERIGDKLKDKP